MNYRGPRERVKDGNSSGVWDYTNMRDKDIYPIGYCAGWHPWTDEQLARVWGDDAAGIKATRAEEELRKQHVAKYHSTGHKTAEEASECYRQYVIDNEVAVSSYDPPAPCHKCGKDTARIVLIGGWPRYNLCEEHSLGVFLGDNFKIGTGVWMASI